MINKAIVVVISSNPRIANRGITVYDCVFVSRTRDCKLTRYVSVVIIMGKRDHVPPAVLPHRDQPLTQQVN